MSKALTTKVVENLKPDCKRREIPDPALSGLYLVVQPSGVKSWALRYRFAHKPKKLTLGRWPVTSVADARREATEALQLIERRVDPAEVRRAQRDAQSAGAPDDTVAGVVELYNKRHLVRLKRGHDTKSSLDRYVVSRWAKREIKTITRRDIRELMDDIMDEGKLITANRIRTRLSGLFNWCIERDMLDHNPVIGVKRLSEVSRTRVLSDVEVRWFWKACAELGQPWGTLGQALLLTGQRLREVAHISATEISGDLWHLPAQRSKNGLAHTVPLCAKALAILTGEERVPSTAELLFTTNGTTPVSGFSKGRGHIAQRMALIAFRERGEPVEIAHWTFHDLRRTAATGMARLGTPVRVTEAVLNHVSGTGGGIVAVYQRHNYAEEKRRALDAWSSHVLSVVETPENLLALVD
ncbi:tyrosine-type recombinase/integrase [Pseudorhodobacter wandonensis]|uniref:tyrosine-type recombinase/integrase n=1 Tax=Pseudorhodobacter wandonensis TaxID=1120568 RepID=UPI00067D835A|nr:site-specific integrase [Pseudorhodobacter wandonensis]